MHISLHLFEISQEKKCVGQVVKIFCLLTDMRFFYIQQSVLLSTTSIKKKINQTHSNIHIMTQILNLDAPCGSLLLSRKGSQEDFSRDKLFCIWYIYDYKNKCKTFYNFYVIWMHLELQLVLYLNLHDALKTPIAGIIWRIWGPKTVMDEKRLRNSDLYS